MSQTIRKPLNLLFGSVGLTIEVWLKDGYVYRGKLRRLDGHMNMLLDDVTEWWEGKLVINYGNVLLRGNNILFISGLVMKFESRNY